MQTTRIVCKALTTVCTLALRARLCKKVCFAQTGSNCRNVAIANLLRLCKPLSEDVLRASYAALLEDHHPQQHGLPSVGKGHKWTMSFPGMTSVEAHALESLAPGCVAVTFVPSQLATFIDTFGRPPWDVICRDELSPGIMYFNHTHCMALVHGEASQWFDCKQSHSVALPPTTSSVRAALRETILRSAGCVLMLSIPGLQDWAHELQTVPRHSSPLFVWRAMQRIRMFHGRPRHCCSSHASVIAEAQQTPRPRWSAELEAGVAEAAHHITGATAV